VDRVLAAEPAILVHFKTIGIVLLVFDRIVVSLLTLGAGQGNLDSHQRHLLIIWTVLPPLSQVEVAFFATKKEPLFKGTTNITHIRPAVNHFFHFSEGF